MTDILETIKRDAVAEILSSAIAQAQSALSRLVAGEARLDAATMELVTRQDAAGRLDEASGRQVSVAVRQSFEGAFAGDILLIFPETGSLELVRSVLGELVPLDSLTEMEQEALMEVGNVVLNACLASLARQLRPPIEGSLPSYLRGRGGRILDAAQPEAGLTILLRLEFTVAARSVPGVLALLVADASVPAFAEAVVAPREGDAPP